VTFSELKVERDKQRVFLFDADAAKAQCLTEVADWPLREDFRDFWTSTSKVFDDGKWTALRKRFAERSIVLPRYPSDTYGLQALLDTLYTAREGHPVGWGYDNLVKCAHHVFDRHKGFLWAFKLVLSANGMGGLIREQDETRNWRNNKVKAYLAAWADPNADGADAFAPDRRFDDLVSFLFPEIANDLRKNPFCDTRTSNIKLKLPASDVSQVVIERNIS
jgi:hypothetical protein